MDMEDSYTYKVAKDPLFRIRHYEEVDLILNAGIVNLVLRSALPNLRLDANRPTCACSKFACPISPTEYCPGRCHQPSRRPSFANSLMT